MSDPIEVFEVLATPIDALGEAPASPAHEEPAQAPAAGSFAGQWGAWITSLSLDDTRILALPEALKHVAVEEMRNNGQSMVELLKRADVVFCRKVLRWRHNRKLLRRFEHASRGDKVSLNKRQFKGWKFFTFRERIMAALSTVSGVCHVCCCAYGSEGNRRKVALNVCGHVYCLGCCVNIAEETNECVFCSQSINMHLYPVEDAEEGEAAASRL